MPAPVADRPESSRANQNSTEGKLATLKAYRRAKGLCFTCGERWSQDHQCKAAVQLHVVQEMLDFFHAESTPYSDDEQDDCASLMLLSTESNTSEPVTAIQLKCSVQNRPVLFLVNSGSSHSFLTETLAQSLPNYIQAANPSSVKVAGGGILRCTQQIPNCQWVCNGFQFQSSFKVLPLKCYDGILGMDWLASLVSWMSGCC